MDLPSILGGLAQGFVDFGKSAVDLFGTGGAAVGDAVESLRTGKVTTKNQDDFRKWLYGTDSVEDAAAKGLGTALNGVQTVTDYIPGIGTVTRNPLFNAGQGALGGLADEFKTYGKDYDLARAGQRAAVSAGSALAGSGLAEALKGSGNAILKSSLAQGAARGGLGGAITGGGYAAIDGGDAMQGALQGAKMGALIGGATGAIQDFKPAKTYDVALTDDERAARIANAQKQIDDIGPVPMFTDDPDNIAKRARISELRDSIKAYQSGYDTTQDYKDAMAARRANRRPYTPPEAQYQPKIGEDVALGATEAPEGYTRLYRGLETEFDPKYVPQVSDNGYGYESWSDSYDLAREYAGPDGNIYSVDVPNARIADQIVTPDGERMPVVRTDKKAGLKSFSDENKFIDGKEYLLNVNDPLRQELTYSRVTPANSLETALAADDMAVNNPRYLTDENGNPRTFYHGSPNKNITEFDINQAGRNTSSGERALYFTDSPEVADEFSYERLPSDSMFVDNRGAKGRVYPVNLEMNNPLDLDNLTDAQIRELWQYASPLGQLDGQEKFIKNLTEFRDAAHNGQLTKTLLDLDKLANSPYDGFTARMYPNQDNQAREYAVFDNSKIKMLEDVLANDDMAVNSAPETAAVIAGKNRSWDELYDMLSRDAGAFENEDRTLITASPSQLRSEIEAIDAKYPNDLPDDIWDRRYSLNQQLKAAEKGYNSPYDYYVGESKKNFRQDFESRPDKYKAKIADIESQAQRQAALDQDIANASPRKLAQFNLIQQKNPAPNETLTWIRSPKDILTWDEAIAGAEGDNAFTWPDYTLEDALRDKKKHSMTVYSSYPIKGGTFVTPSRQQASDYAGGGRVYSKVIRPDDVAWINGDEGQYAYTRKK